MKTNTSITASKPGYTDFTPSGRNSPMSSTQPIEFPTADAVEMTAKITPEDVAIMTADLLDLSKALAAIDAAINAAQQPKAPMMTFKYTGPERGWQHIDLIPATHDWWVADDSICMPSTFTAERTIDAINMATAIRHKIMRPPPSVITQGRAA